MRAFLYLSFYTTPHTLKKRTQRPSLESEQQQHLKQGHGAHQQLNVFEEQRKTSPSQQQPASELSFAELPRHASVLRQQLQRLKDEVALLQVLLCFSCRVSNQASPNSFLQLMQAEAMKERERIVNESRFFNQFVVPLFVVYSHHIFRNFRSIAAEQDEVC